MSGAGGSAVFSTPRRETEAAVFAMWVFVGSEAMLFGAVLLVFMAARLGHGAAFAAAAKHLSLPLGTLNTAVLLTSSFTMALAHRSAAASRWRAAAWMLAVTALLGAVFLAIKGMEYAEETAEGVAPVLGLPFTYAGPDPAQAELFFRLYFVMTGLHALHLACGVAALGAVMALWPRTGGKSRLRRVEAIGLYWHFVDIVWVFMFPVLYLAAR